MMTSNGGGGIGRTYKTLYLPEDLIFAEIIVRLPVKSIGQLRCVSKSWRSLLSSRQFIKSHLNFHINDPEPEHILITTTHPHGIHWVDFSDCISRSVSHQYDFLETMLYLQPASCHGLVLLTVKTRDNDTSGSMTRYLLMNPITKEIEFRALECPYGKGVEIELHGMGYDSVSDDYKIVLIENWIARTASSNEPLAVHVYNIKMKTWRSISFRFSDFCKDIGGTFSDESGVFLDGYLYWIATDNNCCSILLGFNLAREEFEQVPLPRELEKMRISKDFILEIVTVFEGRLALVSTSPLAFNVWTMKEHGVQDSWINIGNNIFTKTESNYLGSHRFLLILNEDEIVMQRNSRNFKAYNWRKETFRDLNIPSGVISKLGTFRGSLVSPDLRKE